MAQDLSIEDPERAFLTTTRTMNSLLWLINNPVLEDRILAYLAKYQSDYGVILYAFILMGNHYHLEAEFPHGNKADFTRDLNSMLARLTDKHVEEFPGGKLWARRARSQKVPDPDDIKHWCFYLALNPVSSGLVEKISDYTAYNSFSDAVTGKVRKFKVVDWTDYNNRKRKNRKLTIEECSTVYELTFSRLPGYDHLSPKEYREMMLTELEKRRAEIVKQRREEGRGFATKWALKQTTPGAAPISTKTSERDTHRPIVLTLSDETRNRCEEEYFAILEEYKRVSKRFRSGERTAVFPNRTYSPHYFVGLGPTLPA